MTAGRPRSRAGGGAILADEQLAGELGEWSSITRPTSVILGGALWRLVAGDGG